MASSRETVTTSLPRRATHLTPLAVLDGFGGAQSVAGGEDAIVGGRGSAPLEVSEDDVARLYAGPFFYLLGERLRYAAKLHVAELVALGALGYVVFGEDDAFADGDEAPLLAVLGALF